MAREQTDRINGSELLGAPAWVRDELHALSKRLDAAEADNASLAAANEKYGKELLKSWEAHTFSIRQHKGHIQRHRSLLLTLAIYAAVFALLALLPIVIKSCTVTAS